MHKFCGYFQPSNLPYLRAKKIEFILQCATWEIGLVKKWSKNLIRLCISGLVRYIIWGRPAKKSTHLSQNRPSATTFQFIYCKSVLCTLWVLFGGLALLTNFDSHLRTLATWNFNFLFYGQGVFGIWGLNCFNWNYSPSSFGDNREKWYHATFTKFRCLHCA